MNDDGHRPQEAIEAWQQYEWARLCQDLRVDAEWWGRVQLVLAVNRLNHPTSLIDDILNQHCGELCDCGHPAGSHDMVDDTVLCCQECPCEAFSDTYDGAW